MNILILGGGGREHSLAWAVKQNPKCDRLIVAPGNAGIAQIAEYAALDIEDGDAVASFCADESISFVIVGPDAPLVAGVADVLRANGFAVFGCSKAAAQLASSKSFTKAICDACDAPIAKYVHFTDAEAAKSYVKDHGAPIVIKADGLAAVDDMPGGQFGDAGAEIVKPTIAEMAKRGTPFEGILYASLMIENGQPRLVEYNVRFGDPECQVLMMRLGGQILDLLLACAQHRLSDITPNWADDHAMTIVMAADGDPGSYETGSEINGLGDLPETSHEMTFHAGTGTKDGQIIATGGRVLNATARGASLQDAHAHAYAMTRQIEWPEGFYRTDIGHRTL